MNDDETPTRDELKRLIRKLQGSQAEVPELPDEKVELIWADHTTVVEIPDGNGRDYYLDVDGGKLYRFDLTEAWVTNLQRESEGLADEPAEE